MQLKYVINIYLLESMFLLFIYHVCKFWREKNKTKFTANAILKATLSGNLDLSFRCLSQ